MSSNRASNCIVSSCMCDISCVCASAWVSMHFLTTLSAYHTTTIPASCKLDTEKHRKDTNITCIHQTRHTRPMTKHIALHDKWIAKRHNSKRCRVITLSPDASPLSSVSPQIASAACSWRWRCCHAQVCRPHMTRGRENEPCFRHTRCAMHKRRYVAGTGPLLLPAPVASSLCSICVCM